MRKKLLICLCLSMAFVFGGMLLISDDVDGAAKQVLTAAKAKTAPQGLDDAVWTKAKAIQTPFEGKEKFAGKKTSVTTKAVYTDDQIYFLFSWSDAAKSVTKGAWKFDGQKWSNQKC